MVGNGFKSAKTFRQVAIKATSKSRENGLTYFCCRFIVLSLFLKKIILLSVYVIIPFDAQITPDLASWSPFRLLLCPFDMSPSVFQHFHTFRHNKMFRDHLSLSLPWPWNCLLLQGALVP